MSRAAFLSPPIASSPMARALREQPDWDRFRAWLLESDRLLEAVWGRMDRYHLAWLNVGRDSAPPGSTLDVEGTSRFIAEVAEREARRPAYDEDVGRAAGLGPRSPTTADDDRTEEER